ncbi:hypothetical protein DC365_17420 [Vibrio vulnificus]|uniref:Uncharacterized protein n=3 Tax=Vibrio TaxID=662 RepID=A0AA47JM94_VIBPH|nr:MULTISPECIES: hypothetical protein [Vibrio]MBE3699161.1 hypothetical protein [Vibrio parahaemolyticus]MBE3748742.1 hypothetical protein [Vibrio parahaemolyticus]MBE3779044.1 hypothetical protein [Vibrio parahaemolyticus]MBE4418129.1 hypothetical protein [Vibrio parahaemolyticus]MBE4475559.1 hypothetical protein [Vibrio parahaemolyticus]
MSSRHKSFKRRPISLINTWHCKLIFRRVISKLSILNVVWDYITKVISSPVILGVITLIQLTAGAVLGANISLAFPTTSYNSLDVESLSLIIWQGIHPFTLYTVLFAIMITLVRALTDSYVDIKRQNLAIRLAEEQRSLPDSLWLRNYHEKYIPEIMNINNSIKQAFDDGSYDDDVIKQSITTLLEISRDMAMSWDSKNKEDYSSNLMLYAPSSIKIASFIKKYWSRNHLFFDSNNPYSAKDEISGILFVAGSVNSHSKFYGNGEHDSEKNQPLILPVCLDDEQAHNEFLSKQSLPGAPEAFRSGSYHYIENVLDEIEKWLTEDYWYYFDESQAQQLYDHYRADHSGKSLISIPILLPITVQELESGVNLNKGTIVGVLNVYSRNIRMLRGNATDFHEFCRPLVSSLALCIAAYEIWTKLPSGDNETPSDTEGTPEGLAKDSEGE